LYRPRYPSTTKLPPRILKWYSAHIDKVIFGERRTHDNRPVMNVTDLGKSDRIFYKLDDNSTFTLTQDEIGSVPEFKPEWAL
jgi:hypothetical protein